MLGLNGMIIILWLFGSLSGLFVHGLVRVDVLSRYRFNAGVINGLFNFMDRVNFLVFDPKVPRLELLMVVCRF